MRSFLYAFLLAASFPLHAQQKPIQYTLRFPAPQTHYVEIEARFPADGRKELDVMMPVWTPGSYLVREYSRHVERMEARDSSGAALRVEKTSKNHWRVTAPAKGDAIVTYRVYGREMTVDTNWIGPEFAMLQGPATFITRSDAMSRPHEVTVELPSHWKASFSGMPSDRPNHFRADDFDVLVDSPIAAGNPSIQEFDVGGRKNVLATFGDLQFWDGPRAAGDLEKIVRENLKLWGSLPYDRYVFLNFVVNAGGGLEHRNSTVMMTRPTVTKTRRAWRGWLGLASHEYFHTWNVKRLRPFALGPFNYDEENYTTDLWIAEGFTSYYGPLLLRRAGLITEREFFETLSDAIEGLQTTPGRLSQPVDLASFDAWIRHYRRDENSPNVSISYYTKGTVIAFVLDAMIRSATNGTRSLDDAMRLAYQRYSGARGFRSDDFETVVGEIGGKGAGDWVRRITATTEELDYKPALDWHGLRFAARRQSEEQREQEQREPRVWLGIETRVDDGRLLITQVRRGTANYESGLAVDDEILAIDGLRVIPDQLAARLQDYRPGDRATVTIARRLRLQPVEVTIEREPEKAWRLERDPNASDAQKEHLATWLGR